MAIRHQKVDTYYRENGKFNKAPWLFSEGSTGLQDYENAQKKNDQQAQQPGE
tara:strand:- start:558 stop:713 length:156 start_codon:yes stop_codon:yes gene_type:complete